MSLAIKPVQSGVVFDPTVRVNSERFYLIEKGGQNYNYQQQVTQNYSNSQISFSVIPPNVETIVDRHVRILVPFSVTFTGADQGTPLLQLDQGVNALRANPISSITNNISLNINNAQFSYPVSDALSALIRYQTEEEDNFTTYSTSPSMPDQSQQYGYLIGSSMNPLNSYKDTQPYNNSRGTFNSLFTVVSNTNTSATITGTVCEDIFLSPLLFGKLEESGFVGISTMNLTFNLTNIQRLWSSDQVNGNVFTSVNVNIIANPSLLMRFITVEWTQPIPEEVIYNYNNVQNFPTNCGTVLSGVSKVQSASNIQLDQIPKLIYIHIRQQNQDQTFATTDTFARITNVSVNFNNLSGIYASATEQDIYHTCIKNGLQVSWPQWTTHVGSVICFQPAYDWGLPANLAPGVAGASFNLTLTATFTNISDHSINYTMYITTVSESVMTISRGAVFPQQSVLTQQDILNAPNLPIMSKLQLKSIYGGDFLNSVKSFGETVLPYLNEAIPYVKTGVALGKAILGAGGGRRISRSQLRRGM